MRGMSRLAMGATLAVAVSLTTLIVILLYLLVSLFCSLAREKRHQCRDDDIAVDSEEQTSRPLSFPFYGHGVLRAPTEYLLSVPNLEAAAAKQASPSPSQNGEDFLRISNPMYDGTRAAAIEEVGADAAGDAVFETPKPSASSFGGDEESFSPPLKLMKKLSSIVQPMASSALFDGRRSLGGSTETNMPSSSSSSSNSPCYSPSW